MTWCITALILCLDTSHRASSVDKPQYTLAYLSLKGGFSGVFFGTGLWQQLAVKPITHLVLIFLQLFFYIFALLQSWTNTWVIMALFLSLVSLFRNNSNNNNSPKLIHKIKITYLMLQNFQFKLSEVKINTELLYTILSEHLI